MMSNQGIERYRGHRPVRSARCASTRLHLHAPDAYLMLLYLMRVASDAWWSGAWCSYCMYSMQR